MVGDVNCSRARVEMAGRVGDVDEETVRTYRAARGLTAAAAAAAVMPVVCRFTCRFMVSVNTGTGRPTELYQSVQDTMWWVSSYVASRVVQLYW